MPAVNFVPGLNGSGAEGPGTGGTPEIVGAAVTVAAMALVAASPTTTSVKLATRRQELTRFCPADSAMPCPFISLST